MRGQATSIQHNRQKGAPKNTPTTIMPLWTRLPSYLQPLCHFRSARPSMVSSGLGSDVSGNLSVAINTWKLPDISSLHNVSRTGISLKRDDANFISQKTRKRTASHQHQNLGGAERDRTADPLLAKQVLSQLSYSPFLRFRLRGRRAYHQPSANGGPGQTRTADLTLIRRAL